MIGWSADGRTNPKTWRQCPHEYLVDERCTTCRAKRVTDVAQPAPSRGVGTPLGSPFLQLPRLSGAAGIKGDETSVDRFMQTRQHRKDVPIEQKSDSALTSKSKED